MMAISKKNMRRIRGVLFKLPLMITCKEFEDFILDYLEGELSAKQSFVFEMHLKVCSECRDYLKAYRAAVELAKKGVQREETVALDEVPTDLIQAVVEARDA